MANYRKSFNFRNGVQVDDDNLIVSPLGLVGIGTTVPLSALDVYGDVSVTGVITNRGIYVSGVSTVQGNSFVGSAISMYAATGIISASRYYGDGSFLLNLPTSQWIDIDVGLGYTSIYSAGNVGIATSDPRFSLQVGQNPITRYGIGINSSGDVYTSGIITAYSYVGFGTGITNVNASNISSGTLSNSRLPSNINISGILTASRLVATNVDINSTGVFVSGVTTSISGFVGNLTGNVTGNVTGNIVGDIVGIASTARSLIGTPDILVGFVTAAELISNFSRSGISTITNRLYVQNSVGIGSTSPTTDLQIRKTGTGGIQITSTDESFISIGSSNSRDGKNAEFRFGNLVDSFSGSKSADIVNYDTGNLNQYIHLGAAGVGTGDFNWIYGQDQSALMTLTWQGKLGIAKTNPDHQLHVVGTSTITEDLYIGDDLFVKGDSSFIGNVNITGNFTTNNLNVTSGITANINNVSGVSTFFNIDVNNLAKINKIAIGTDSTNSPFQIGVGSESIILSSSNFIGIGQTLPLPEVNICANNASVIIRAVGVGTTRPRSAVDFSDAGKGYFQDAKRFFLPPKVTTVERNLLDISSANHVIGISTFDVDADGAIVYNTTIRKHETYSGITSSWSQLGGITGINTIATSSFNRLEVNQIAAAEIFTVGVLTATSFDGGSNFSWGSATATTSSTAQAGIHSTLATTTYRSVEYTIQASEGTNFHTTKINALHNGSSSYHTEYGTVYNNVGVSTYDVDISGGKIRLLAYPTSSGITTFKIVFNATKI